MFRGYRYAIIAVVGWLVCSPLSYAQQQTSPALESQPVTPSQKKNASQGNADNGSSEQPQAEILAPALKQIESAIRDIVPKKDEAGDQRQEDRDKADLQAQEDMAFWAKGMFWATAATVIITLAGLALIARTLHHTRRAANYAEEMVVEAKATTAATLKLIDQEQTNAQRQLRAYIIHYLCYVKGLGGPNPQYIFESKNHGQTPARNVRVWTAWRYFDVPGYELPTEPNPDMLLSSMLLGPESTTHAFDNVFLDQNRMALINAGTAVFFVFGKITYQDIFEEDHTTRFRCAMGGKFGPAQAGGSLLVCDEGNEFD